MSAALSARAVFGGAQLTRRALVSRKARSGAWERVQVFWTTMRGPLLVQRHAPA